MEISIEQYNKMAERLTELEYLLAECQWIPCSKRLPEEGQIVLATHLGGIDPNRQVIEHIYSGGKFLSNWDMDMEFSSPTFGERYMGKVIAWMPLPEPYRAERRTDETD